MQRRVIPTISWQQDVYHSEMQWKNNIFHGKSQWGEVQVQAALSNS